MGRIDSRLQKVMQITKEGYAIPIIVETISAPSASDIQELRGYMAVRNVLSIANNVIGNAYSGNMQKIAGLPFVSVVYYDEPVSRFQLPVSISVSENDIHIPVSDSAQAIGAAALHDVGITGKGIKIAIIDTGVNKHHVMLSGSVINEINIAKKHGAEYADTQDKNGHGTHVASTAAGKDVVIHSKLLGKDLRLHGVAPDASIINVKVLDDGGSGQTSWVMEGVEEAVKAGADVINMSLGSMFDGAGLSPDSKLVNKVSIELGIPCCVAAGNSFVNFTIGSPGGAMGAITVASNAMRIPSAGMVSTFSSKGATTDGRVKPDISAPGGNLMNIKETIYAATSGTLEYEAKEPFIGIMGSSMATPHVSGAVALLLQAGMKKDRFHIEDLLAMTSKYQHVKDIYTGWGMIDVKNAYDYTIRNEQLVPVSEIMRFTNSLTQPLAAIIPKPEAAEAHEVRLPYLK